MQACTQKSSPIQFVYYCRISAKRRRLVYWQPSGLGQCCGSKTQANWFNYWCLFGTQQRFNNLVKINQSERGKVMCTTSFSCVINRWPAIVWYKNTCHENSVTTHLFFNFAFGVHFCFLMKSIFLEKSGRVVFQVYFYS